MGKKVVYRFVDGERDDNAPIVYTDGGPGSTTEMDVVQARNGLPDEIQKDQIVFNRQENAFYVGAGDGSPQRVTDVRTYERLSDRPKIGVEGRLYVILRDSIFSLWRENAWRSFSMSPVTVAQYYGVSSFTDKTDFPKEGETNHIYLTKDGFGYAWTKENGYVNIFGDKTWSWTKAESDARFAFKKDIPVIPSLSDLGGITPHDVDVKIQAAEDDAAAKYATIADNALKADAADVYTKQDADDKFLDKADKPTLSSLGALSTEQAENTYLKKASFDKLTQDVDTIQKRVNTLSEYSKTTEMQKAIDDSAAKVTKIFDKYMLADDIDKALSQKADNVSVMKKTDMGAYALKGDIPTLTKLGGVSRTEIENTYARKTSVDALEKNVKDTYYPKTDMDTKLSGIYTKPETDAQIKAALPKEPWTDFAKTADVAKDYMAKADSYTKSELDTRLQSIQAHGVDLSKCLMKDDTDTDTYLTDKVKKTMPDLSTYQKTDGLLSEMIKQDKAKGNDLMLDYFANKRDVQNVQLEISKSVVEHGTLNIDENGNQYIDIKESVMQRPELLIGHNPIRLFVNGVRYTEGVDFSYDKETNRLKWCHTEEDGYFRLTSEDELRIEHETPVSKTKAPESSKSSTNPNAPIVAIAEEDLNTIRDCTKRAEDASTAAAKSSTDAKDSEAKAAASAQDAAKSAKDVSDEKAVIVQKVKDAEKRADDAVNVAPKTILVTVHAADWQSGLFMISDARIQTESTLLLNLKAGASEDMKKAFIAAGIDASSQLDGSVTLKAEAVPTVDLDLKLVII